jgi:hypothetical protein
MSNRHDDHDNSGHDSLRISRRPRRTHVAASAGTPSHEDVVLPPSESRKACAPVTPHLGR